MPTFGPENTVLEVSSKHESAVVDLIRHDDKAQQEILDAFELSYLNNDSSTQMVARFRAVMDAIQDRAISKVEAA